MRIKYDAEDDILYVAFSQEPIVRDVSNGWNVNVGYAAGGISDITILDAKAVMRRNLSKLLGEITVNSRDHPRYKLADLLAEMPDGLPRAEDWDEMLAVGRENC